MAGILAASDVSRAFDSRLLEERLNLLYHFIDARLEDEGYSWRMLIELSGRPSAEDGTSLRSVSERTRGVAV